MGHQNRPAAEATLSPDHIEELRPFLADHVRRWRPVLDVANRPFQESSPSFLVAPLVVGAGRAGIGVLPVSIPVLACHQRREAGQHFGVEHLVLEHPREVGFVATDLTQGVPVYDEIANRLPFVYYEVGRQSRRRDQPTLRLRPLVRPRGQNLAPIVTIGLTIPTPPPLGGTDHDLALGMQPNMVELPSELARQPHVVGVEKGDPLTPSQLDSEVAGCAHAAIGPARMGGEHHSIAEGRRQPGGQLAASIGGAVVDQDELP